MAQGSKAGSASGWEEGEVGTGSALCLPSACPHSCRVKHACLHVEWRWGALQLAPCRQLATPSSPCLTVGRLHGIDMGQV